MQENLPQFSWASLGCVLTAPQRATALHKTETLHDTVGGPQIIQYLSEYKERRLEWIGEDRLVWKASMTDSTKQPGLSFCLPATVFIYGLVK